MINISNATKTYYGYGVESKAITGVSTTIKSKEICFIIGKSGSGKSTLLNCIAGIEELTSGSIEVDNHRIECMSQNELIFLRQKYFGYIFQSYNLLPQYTALENVTLPLLFRGESRNERNAKAKELLARMGISHLANKRVNQMSGGEQQRIAIARALIGEPQYIFADEPTGNLDSHNTIEVMEILCENVYNRDCTLILVTHDLGVSHYANHIITLGDGRIINEEWSNNRV